MAELGEMVEAGVRMFSDDGRCIPTARMLRNALTYARAFEGVVIAEHCEDASLAEGGQMHEGYHSASLGLAGQPREAEEVVVARDLAVTRLTGGRLHLCHLSSAGSVEMVRRAKAEGLRVTAEVTPHHLVFTDADLVTYDTNLKVNPPLRTAEDREALRAGLADGTIDAVATDHAPHAVEEKEVEFDQAPPGTIGLETALAAVLTHLVEPGALPLARAIEALSTAPARVLGAGEHGGPIEPGRPAHLVLFDPEATWVVEAPFASRSRNCAFLGSTLRGRVVHTVYGGTLVVADGKPQR
jgi:dihydroorotase